MMNEYHRIADEEIENFQKVEAYLDGVDTYELQLLVNSLAVFLQIYSGSEIQNFTYFTAYIELMKRHNEE